MDFTYFGLNENLLEGIQAMNYEIPTPVQQQVIPEILSGHDVIASAQTGTGKTAAFLLPIIQQIMASRQGDHIKALVIVPTRELAIQIAEQAEGFGYFTSVSSLAVYGGGDGQLYETEKSALKKGVDIVVCTPGRMISHLTMGYVKFDQLKFLVLDEADRMLDMGFHDDIIKIVSHLPKERQSLLFSATMPHRMRELARKILRQAKEINIALSRPPDKIRQEAYVVFENQKIRLTEHLIRETALKSIVVFCETKSKVKDLCKVLKKTEKATEEIHSDLEQKERGEVMNRFKNRQIRVLVATDIISRGIDVEDIDMIINYNVPGDAEDYVHRIGRTARAESEGRAVTLIGEKEQGKFSQIEKLIGRTVEKNSLPADFDKVPEFVPLRRHSSDKGRRQHPVRKKDAGQPGSNRKFHSRNPRQNKRTRNK
ncbi:MAG TPA: DEAD/DEAH box helicase [Bacteroidales bacterium]|nr:DEAD/DEAH box helicase [Bacteroidales bacterium]